MGPGKYHFINSSTSPTSDKVSEVARSEARAHAARISRARQQPPAKSGAESSTGDAQVSPLESYDQRGKNPSDGWSLIIIMGPFDIDIFAKYTPITNRIDRSSRQTEEGQKRWGPRQHQVQSEHTCA